MSGRFEGKSAIVTGAGNGIGEAIARRLARDGARVLAVDIEESAARTTRESDGRITFWRSDVSKAGDVADMVAEAEKRFGRIDLVANNAGVSGGSTPFHETTEETWDKVIGVNLRGAFLVLRASIAALLKAGGAIVNTGSIGSFRATPGAGAYISSKGGLLMMTRQAALEYARQNIRVNIVCPGTIDTRLLERAPKALREMLINQIPMGRFGGVDEVASAATFLLSDDASYVTGAALIVDGGRSAG